MEYQSLNGFWQVRQTGTPDWISANVPGGVHTDLMAAGKLPDPFYGTNEEEVQWVAEKNWEYRRFFYPTPALLRQERIWLVCAGLDTLAEVRLNGKILGQADNMFRCWRWEVKSLLVEGENRLEILFRSPISFIRARERVKRMTTEMSMGIGGGPNLRKTPSHFGWDWGPRLVCTGIWQEVRLEGRSRGQLGEIRFDQSHGRSQGEGSTQAYASAPADYNRPAQDTPAVNVVTLTANIQCVLWEGMEERHTLRLRISGPDRRVWLLDAPARPLSVMTVTITNPSLWWPNGYGEQALYTAEVSLLGSEEQLIDTRIYTLGLRTIELRQDEDPYGKSFTFVVNGQAVFCKGSNWIPADSFPTRLTPERVERLLRAALEANHNMLRVWGGGYYESDAFYDLCDRLGILVWQDFQYACALYPLDDEAYLENALCEAQEAARRLRHHASLALWCGNNEIEMLGGAMGWFKKAPALKEAFERFFYHQLPEALKAEDPQRTYWPGSPSSNAPFQSPNSEKVGDAHLWEVYHMFKPANFYRQQNPRFVSEFGFQSLPAQRTIDKFATEKDCSMESKVMACHQRALAGNPKLVWYLAQRFRLPRTFAGWVYLSQVYQAETIRVGVEHWRRHPERTSGALYWQLNDCWPVISWSSIDYEGRWKALHYAARQFFAPVLLSIEDTVEKNQRKMDVWLTNDTANRWQGRLHWTLETLEGQVIEGGDQPVLVTPRAAGCIVKLDFARHNGKVDWRKTIFVAELYSGSTTHSLGAPQVVKMATFVPEVRMPVVVPRLRCEAEVHEGLLVVQVESQRLARFVELSLEGADVVFSDNFFDLPAGRCATITARAPEGWTAEQARAALRVRSLADMGPVDGVAASHWKGDRAFFRMLGGMVWEGLVKPRIKR